MITVRVKVTGYIKERHICTAELLNGDIVNLDPYVGCAISLTDEECEAGKGADIVGKSFLLTEYYVHKGMFIPYEGGMIPLV